MDKSRFGLNQIPMPPTVNTIEYIGPHSPFQKLIEFHRKSCGFSLAQLAKKIGVPHVRLYIWMHNIHGIPHMKAFDRKYIRRLAEVLNISRSDIKGALDASRRIAARRVIDALTGSYGYWDPT
ncbi:MAG TPA: helix-turn-helix transcriptional regulator [Candidatus Udaeobacter sp.]|nr:helix-turn-helix transcriptional regulator [Candidatus Udaeobacter sp.]